LPQRDTISFVIQACTGETGRGKFLAQIFGSFRFAERRRRNGIDLNLFFSDGLGVRIEI
jgi:hypothetical protein